MNNKYFDQILGSQEDLTSKEDRKITKHILDAYVKEQPIEKVRENQRIGIKLLMKSYLTSDTQSIVHTGEFLNKLLEVYNIKKSKFAEHIGYENANLHAILGGRRKFNSKLATIMSQVFNIDPELWLFIEAKNELKAFKSQKEINLKKINLKELSHDRKP